MILINSPSALFLKKSTAFMLNFSGDQSLPAHKHPGSHVFLQVISGGGAFIIDGEEHTVSAGDYLFVTGEEELAFKNNTDADTSIHVLLNRTPDERFATNI